MADAELRSVAPKKANGRSLTPAGAGHVAQIMNIYSKSLDGVSPEGLRSILDQLEDYLDVLALVPDRYPGGAEDCAIEAGLRFRGVITDRLMELGG
jgi:hypothetical protein